MLRLLLFFSLFSLALALIARWWFGARVLDSYGKRMCRCDLKLWTPAPHDAASVHRAEASAEEFGNQLRQKALQEWRQTDPKSANAREQSRRFGVAAPPLGGVVAVLAVIAGKIPVLGAFAIFIVAVALSAVLGILALPPELTAIARTSKRIRDQRAFPSSEDSEAIVRCASAHAWEQALPPVLRMLKKR
ncbi:MAG: hypothetical protein RLZ22_408 [Verrucomicrobiota bacterium]|jgi:Flp pilus assembly protein TadB